MLRFPGETTNRSGNQFFRNCVFSALILLACLFADEKVVAQGEADINATAVTPILPVEFQAYRIQIEINADPSDRDLVWINAFERNFKSQVARTFGKCWSINWLPRRNSKQIRSSHQSPVSGAKEITQPDSAQPDKTSIDRTSIDVVFSIDLAKYGNEFHASVESFEPLWKYHSPRMQQSTRDSRELPGETLRMLYGLFRPQAEWELVDENRVHVRVKAGSLEIPDPDFPLLRADEVFQPAILYRHRDGRFKQVAVIPWTLLHLKEAEAGSGIATVNSGLRQPLSGRPRGKITRQAVALRPHWPETKLELVSQATPPRVLVAHEIQMRPHVTQRPGETRTPEEAKSQRLVSDRSGHVQLAANAPAPFVWMAVFSGDQRLAEVPIVPGSVTEARLELPDDALRLRAEGQLKMLQSELVAVVAEKAALMLVCRAAAKSEDWSAVDTRLSQLTKLPEAAYFLESISGVRVPSIAAARTAGDRLTEQRIERMCDELQTLVRRYLTDDKLQLLREEMAELKAASASSPHDGSR